MEEGKLSRADKLRIKGIEKYGSEAAWRAKLKEWSNRADRSTPRGFEVLKYKDPEGHRKISSKGGKTPRRKKGDNEKTT